MFKITIINHKKVHTIYAHDSDKSLSRIRRDENEIDPHDDHDHGEDDHNHVEDENHDDHDHGEGRVENG